MAVVVATTATAERLSGSTTSGRQQSSLGRERGLEGVGAHLETKPVYVAL
jgi:hypothetical protein